MFHKRLIILSLLIILCGSSVSFAKTTRTVLSNGLTVVVSEIPTSPMVAVYGMVKTGSATETDLYGTGVSHFLEHMLFKRTEKYGVGEIPAKIQAVGGSINATTSFDYTNYTINVPYDQFDSGLDILSEMLMRPVFNEGDIEKERDVIFGEMRMRDDRPNSYHSRLVFKTSYIQHPYRHPIIGYRDIFARVTKDDLLKYYKAKYVPNNIVVSIAGNIKTSEIMPKIEKAFEEFKRASIPPRSLFEPEQISPRKYEEAYPTNLTRLALSFPSTPLMHKDLYALDVLANILGGGVSSRLYNDVYKKRDLVHSISTYNYTPYDQGIFAVSASCDYKNIEEAIEAILSNIEMIKARGVKKSELVKVKKQAIADYQFSRQTASSIAFSQAFDEAFTGDYSFSANYVDGIQNVTTDDIKAVANKYLKTSVMNTIVLKPEEQEDLNSQNETESNVGEIKRHVLDNGIVLLLREDDSVDIVSSRVLIKGGTREESLDLLGISNIMAKSWIKGTKKQSPEKLAEIVESNGIALSSFSGKNSFGMSVQALKEDTPLLIHLINDVVNKPLFDQQEIDKLIKNANIALDTRKDNIFREGTFQLKQVLYKEHPFRRDPNGTKETLTNIDAEKVKSFYQHLLNPANIVISVFGNIDSDEMLKQIEKKFSKLKPKAHHLLSYGESQRSSAEEVEIKLKKEQAAVLFGFHGTTLSSVDRYQLEVATSILGSSFSGRLFTKVRENIGGAYAVGGSQVPGIDNGMIYFYALTNVDQVDEVKSIIKNEIVDLQNSLVPENELLDTQTYLKGNFKASQETNASLSFSSALDELYGLGFKNYLDYDQKIDDVTRKDVQSIANKYFDMDKVVVLVVKPVEPSSK